LSRARAEIQRRVFLDRRFSPVAVDVQFEVVAWMNEAFDLEKSGPMRRMADLR